MLFSSVNVALSLYVRCTFFSHLFLRHHIAGMFDKHLGPPSKFSYDVETKACAMSIARIKLAGKGKIFIGSLNPPE